ncbi:hypothetical protein GKQ38_02360 [Candidatus Nanohaloarchaea archaeon]|nr:hypothetical protein GKQ38_02360 [Candidatus Nanohaloarchaea archaeon]
MSEKVTGIMFSKSKISVLLALSLLMLVLTPAAAAETVFGDDIRVDTNTSTTVFGKDVIVERAGGNLTLFANTVKVKGPVKGDLTVYASQVEIWGAVEGNAEIYAESFSLRHTGAINGSLKVVAQNAHINGSVQNSTVDSERLVIDSLARVNGTLIYDADTFEKQANVTGKILRKKIDSRELDISSEFTDIVTEAVTAVIRMAAGLVLIALAPAYARRVDESFRGRTAASAFLGLASLIFLPAAALVLAFTFVGLPLAALIGIVFIVLLLLGTFYGPYSIMKRAIATEQSQHDYLAMFLGVLLWLFLDLIPVVGAMAQAVIMVIGIGAFILPAWNAFGKKLRR